MATKNLILLSTLFLALLSSCTQQKYATTSSSYENDEVYYQQGDTYITDYALVDNLPDQKPDNYVDPNQVDDYYDPSTQSTPDQIPSDDYVDDSYADTEGNITNNYYGTVYQDNNSGWGLNSPYYGNYGWNNWRPYNRLSWNPYTGWTYNFSWGYTNWNSCWGGYGWNDPWYGGGYCSNWGYGWNSPYYGWGNGWNSPYYGWGNGWNSPYYGWGYGNYYNINNYYGSGNWGNNDGGFGGGLVYGPRPTISVGSSVSSSYEGGTLGHHIGTYSPGNDVKPTAGTVAYEGKPAVKPLESAGNEASLHHDGKLTEQPNAVKPLHTSEPTLAASPAGPSLASGTSSKPVSLSDTGVKSPPASMDDKPLHTATEGSKPTVEPAITADLEPSTVVIPRDPWIERDYYTVPRKPASSSQGNSGSVERERTSTGRAQSNGTSRGSSNANTSTRTPSKESTSRPSNENTSRPSPSGNSREETRPESRPSSGSTPSYKPEPRPEVKAPKPEVKAPKPEVKAPKPEVKTPKPEYKAPKPESRPTPNPPSVKPPSNGGGGGGSRNSGGNSGGGGSKGGGGGGTSPRKK